MNRAAWILGAAALAFGGSAFAGALPPMKQAGSVSYRSGGIGQAESDAFKSDQGNHPLILQFFDTVQGGKSAYSSGEHVTIEKPSGETVFTADTDGPFMLVDLPNGRYAISATENGQTETRWVDVSDKSHRHVTFVWASG